MTNLQNGNYTYIVLIFMSLTSQYKTQLSIVFTIGSQSTVGEKEKRGEGWKCG